MRGKAPPYNSGIGHAVRMHETAGGGYRLRDDNHETQQKQGKRGETPPLPRNCKREPAIRECDQVILFRHAAPLRCESREGAVKNAAGNTLERSVTRKSGDRFCCRQ